MFRLPSHLLYASISKSIRKSISDKYEQKKNKLIPFFPQKVNVSHAIPGRVRLQSNQWRNDKVAKSLETELKKHHLVERVDASPITGSLLIELNEPYLTKKQFQQLMQQVVDSAHPHKENNHFIFFKNLKKYIKRSMD
jgi:hypothetical protein